MCCLLLGTSLHLLSAAPSPLDTLTRRLSQDMEGAFSFSASAGDVDQQQQDCGCDECDCKAEEEARKKREAEEKKRKEAAKKREEERQKKIAECKRLKKECDEDGEEILRMPAEGPNEDYIDTIGLQQTKASVKEEKAKPAAKQAQSGSTAMDTLKSNLSSSIKGLTRLIFSNMLD